MQSFKEIYKTAASRHGGARALEAELPKAKSKASLRRLRDDRVLAEMTRWVFSAGFVWRVIENKWDGFEEAFEGFDPAKIARLSQARLNALARDTRIVRNPQKIKATRDNARFLVELAEEHGRAGRWLASWPEHDIVGLWEELARRGSRLGGMTGQLLLRNVGVDTPILGGDVVKALRVQKVLETKNSRSKQALRAIQEALNTWREESGRSLAEISKILACSVP